MNVLKYALFAGGLLLMIASICSSQAVASPATGYNPELASNPNVFIPLKLDTSGTLGDLLNGTGPQIIGRIKDSVALIGDVGSPDSWGWLDFVIHFDISADITPENPLLTGGTLAMIFRDLDFKPVNMSGRVGYSEVLMLQVSLEGIPLGDLLEINSSNYDSPDFNATLLPSETPGGPDFDTNNAMVRYEFDLGTPSPSGLGISAAEFALISAAEAFDMCVRLESKVEHLRDAKDVFRNTAEVMDPGSDFQFEAVPEPGTLALVTAGAVLVGFRQKRRAL